MNKVNFVVFNIVLIGLLVALSSFAMEQSQAVNNREFKLYVMSSALSRMNVYRWVGAETLQRQDALVFLESKKENIVNGNYDKLHSGNVGATISMTTEQRTFSFTGLGVDKREAILSEVSFTRHIFKNNLYKKDEYYLVRQDIKKLIHCWTESKIRVNNFTPALWDQHSKALVLKQDNDNVIPHRFILIDQKMDQIPLEVFIITRFEVCNENCVTEVLENSVNQRNECNATTLLENPLNQKKKGKATIFIVPKACISWLYENKYCIVGGFGLLILIASGCWIKFR